MNTSSVSKAAEMALTVAGAVYRTGAVIVAALLGFGLLFICLTHVAELSSTMAKVVIGTLLFALIVIPSGALFAAKTGDPLPRIRHFE